MQINIANPGPTTKKVHSIISVLSDRRTHSVPKLYEMVLSAGPGKICELLDQIRVLRAGLRKAEQTIREKNIRISLLERQLVGSK
jgi:hypothetical protein